MFTRAPAPGLTPSPGRSWLLTRLLVPVAAVDIRISPLSTTYGGTVTEPAVSPAPALPGAPFRPRRARLLLAVAVPAAFFVALWRMTGWHRGADEVEDWFDETASARAYGLTQHRLLMLSLTLRWEMPLEPGEQVEMMWVRFRTMGDWPLTGAHESHAETIEQVVEELRLSRVSERHGRLIDSDQDASMERKKREGYF